MSLVFLISIAAIGVVVSIGMPVISSASESTEIKNAQDDMKFVDDYIRSVAAEGRDAVRIYKFSSPKSFQTLPGDDVVQYSKEVKTSFVQYLTRTITGDLLSMSGNNVNCADDGTYYVLENDKLAAYFRKINGTIDTADIIYKIVQKTNNATVFVGNSSILVDGSSAGVGYTQISSGLRLPACQLHAAVNSTVNYDVYYRLYAGADFLVVDVRNIS